MPTRACHCSGVREASSPVVRAWAMVGSGKRRWESAMAAALAYLEGGRWDEMRWNGMEMGWDGDGMEMKDGMRRDELRWDGTG
jgi:hypothetical protein